MRLTLEIGEVDFERGVLLTLDEERRLRPLELRLLAYMAERADVVLSTAQLLRDVWGYADGVETRTLYATINRLRLALERDPGAPTHILTVPRQGYRFRPRGAAPAPSSGPPSASNRFIGRDAERERLRALLAEHRLVTLRGPAGVGKSRLAMELCREGSAQPVIWCDLSGAPGEAELARALAGPLGLDPALRELAPVATALADHPDSVLVLNDADPALEVLRAHLPQLLGEGGPRVLVTSRGPLWLPGEVQLALGPLDAPADRLALLEARAHERNPEVELPPDAPWVAPLLDALGGLPLAIELAAPWLTVLSGDELLGHVRDDLLELHAPTTTTGRHRSLVETLRWSWPLLTDDERHALLCCASFCAPFDLRAARAVAAREGAPAPTELFLRLVERSWLRVSTRSFGQVFSFYAGQREFLLQQAPEPTRREARARHARFHSELARVQDVEALFIVGGPEWQRLRARAPDLRQAMAEAAPADQVALALTLGRVMLAEHPLDETTRMLDEALAAAPPGTPDALVLIRYRAAAARSLGQVAEARAALEGALGLAAAPQHALERGRILRALGVLEMYHGDPEAAQFRLEAAQRALAGVGARLDEAIAWAELGTLAFLRGQLDPAITRLSRGLAPLREAGSSWVYAVYLVNLGVVELIDGQIEAAAVHLEEALTLHRRCGAARFEALALGNLALVEEARGALDRAHAHLDAAFAIARRTADRAEEGALWSNRGLVHLRAGQPALALVALDRAEALANELGITRLAAEVAIRRARVHLALAEPTAAARLLRAAAASAQAHGFVVEAREAKGALAALEARGPSLAQPEAAR